MNILLGILLVIIFFILVIICDALYINSFVKKVINLLKSNRYNEASTIIDIKNKKQPKRILNYYCKLLVYFEMGDLDNILRLIEFIDKNKIRHFPFNDYILNIEIKVLYLKNNIRLANKKYDQFVNLYRKKIKRNL